MEIKEVLAQWEAFKEEYQKEIDDFNNHSGKFSREGLLERASVLKEYRTIISDIHTLLAIGDFIENINNSGFIKMLDECAFERGWSKHIPDVDWKDDKNKLFSVAPLSPSKTQDYSEYIPFDYVDYKTSGRMTTISFTGCPIIKLYKNDRGRFQAEFNDDMIVNYYLRKIDWGLRH